VRQFITMDETWIHHYTPESKQQSTVDRSRLFSAKEDKEDYLEKGKTITGEYYSNLLTRLDEKIREKRPGLQKKKSSFIRTMHLITKVFWQWEN